MAMGIAKGQIPNEAEREDRLVEVVQTRVFAASQNGGNPCPVILSGDHLGDPEMQRLSQKFVLDTVFILRPQSKDADVRLRYFVPDHEMGISGHATIAAITVAVDEGRLKSGLVKVETLNGVFTVTCARSGNQLLVTLEQNRPTFGPAIPPSAIAGALRVSSEDVARESPIQSVSVSRSKLLVPLRHGRSLDAMKPNFDALWTLCDSLQVTGVYPFTRNTNKPNADVEARQFPLRAGFPEDAATGVAAAALGAYLVKYDRQYQTGENRFRIAQGYAMGVPSLIEVLVDCEDSKITRTAIRGQAVIIDRERIALS